MSLPIVGMLAMLIIVGFTFVTAFRVSKIPGQTIRSSLVEAWSNVLIGFGINYVANLAILPLVGAKLTLTGNFWIGCIYTVISVMRTFLIRRYFNTVIARAAGRRS